MRKYISVILLFLISYISYSQTIEVKDVETENYPELKLSLETLDDAGEKVKFIESNNIEVVEIGDDGREIIRNIKEIICEQDVVRFNLMIVLDITTSMLWNMVPGSPTQNPGIVFEESFPNRRIDVVSQIIKDVIIDFDTENSDYCLTTFANFSQISIEWTKDKSLINDVLQENINLFNLTDYNMAFLGKNNVGQTSSKGVGALEYAKTSPNGYKPIILFFTDGGHRGGEFADINTREIIDSANVANASIYVSSFLPGSIPTEVSQFADDTDGEARSVETKSEIQLFFQDVLTKVAENPTVNPCHIVYDTDCEYGDVFVRMNNSSTSWTDALQYDYKNEVDIPTQVPALNITDIVKLNDAGDYSITVEAVNKDVKITGFVDNGNLHFEPTIPANGNIIRVNAPEELFVTLTGEQTEAHCLEKITFLTEDLLFSCSGNTIDATAEFITADGKNVGQTTINVPITGIGAEFTNNSCETVTVTNAVFKSGDDNQFFFLSNNATANSDETINLQFSFNPDSDGTKSAIFTLNTSKGDYDINITGGGSGLPDITANNIDMGNIDCRTNTFPTQTVTISNTGLADLVITNISFNAADDVDFDFSIVDPLPQTIAPNDELEVTITFNSAVDGTKTANLIVESNADNKTIYNIPITGVRNIIDLSVNSSSIDLGNVCIGNDVPLPTLNIQNEGNTDFDFTIDNANNDFTTSSNLTLATGATNNLDVILSGQPSGPYSGVLDIVDACGNITAVNVIANFIDAELTQVGTNIVSSDFSVPLIGATITYQVENFDVSGLVANFLDDASGKFTNISVSPTSAIIGDEITITFDYTPNDFNQANGIINLTGNPCLDLQLAVIGEVGKKTATFQSTNYSGRVSEVIDVEFILEKSDLSSTNVEFELEYDGSIISIDQASLNTSIFTLGTDTQIGNIITTPVTAVIQNQNDETYTIPFVALLGTGGMTSPLNFNTPSNLNANPFVLVSSASNYNVIEVEAYLPLSDYEVKVGEVFQIELKVENVNNLDGFNGSIEGELKFNGTVISPIRDTPMAAYDSELNKTISVTIPIGESVQYEFRATTGTSPFTTIELLNAKSTIGEVLFSNQELKTVTITNLHPDGSGGFRLFDPSLSPLSINLSPNPSLDNIYVEVDILEEGFHDIWITNLQGIRVLTLESKNMMPGKIKYDIGLNKLNAGSYFIIIQAPNDRISKNFNVIK